MVGTGNPCIYLFGPRFGFDGRCPPEWRSRAGRYLYWVFRL